MNKPKKIRADVLLVDRGLVESRAKAQALIMAGAVMFGESKVQKAGQPLPEDANLRVITKEHPWVSRGGMKLDKGLSHFNLDITGFAVLDVGASTGGFTDVSLHNGAEKVYAVDVGHGQIAWKLRTDERVVVLEKQNARYLDAEIIPDPIDLLVCDASFISLKTVLPAGMALVKEGGWMIALIKPQFEVGRENVGKKGVVRDPELHQAVCDDIETWLDGQDDWQVLGIIESPIKGPEGNIEFLIGAQKQKANDE